MGPEKRENDILGGLDTSAERTCPLYERDCPVQREVNQLKSECKRLRELSRTDPLTGFFNFRHLLAMLSAEMERTRRSGLPTGLLMVDLDHFKHVNDTYGHEAGNKALKWVSKITLQNIRRIDIPCRFGGEEFIIILPVTNLPQAVRAAERLRKALEKAPVVLGDLKTTVTASIGVDVYRGRMKLSPDDFIERVDRFLLNAKSQGRNCVRYDQEKAGTVPTEVTSEERKALFGKGLVQRPPEEQGPVTK